MRRHRPSWMTGSDDRILEFLAESGAAHNFQGIVNNFADNGEDISYSTVKRRIPKLVDAGLIREIEGKGRYYAITDRGRAYLAGELDVEEIDD